MRVELAKPDGRVVYDDPIEIVAIERPEAAIGGWSQLEAALAAGRHVAGFLSYELGSALNGLPVRRGTLPLARFGIYAAPAARTPPPVTLPPALDPPVAGWSRARYDAALERIAASLRAGDAYQINLTVPFAVGYDGDARALFDALASRADVAHAALVEFGETALVSISPELFLAFDGDRIETRPMKGTASPDDARALASAKNRAEHVMIVDLLRNDLHRVCDAVAVERLFAVERYPTYATMTSTLAGTVRSHTGLAEILAATFPCGSVTGAPKLAAMTAIAALEAEPRGIAMGAIGALAPGRRGSFSVAIRTLELDSRTRTGVVRIGGGIVADSNASDEWAEIFVKRRAFEVPERRVDLFETIRVGAPAREIADHLARLCDSADRLGIAYDELALRTTLERAARVDGGSPLLARVTLRADGTIDVARRPFHPAPQVASIAVTSARVRAGDPLLRHKTSRRAPYEAAAREARARDSFEGLVLNDRGEIADGARTTVFVRRDPRAPFATPPLASGALGGILRARLLHAGDAVESVLRPGDLETAIDVYVGNAARGLIRCDLLETQERLRSYRGARA